MNAQIRAATAFLIECELLVWERVASLRSLRVNPEFNQICLDPESSYEDVYVAGLGHRHFNMCLFDQSYFQFSGSGADQRLAYYPNPFVRHDGLLELIEDPLDLEAFDLDDLRATGGRAPVRFDLSPGQYAGLSHPYAHFHLGHGELGRLASRRVFCPLSFAMVVTRLYYPDHWTHGDCALEDGFTNDFDRRLAQLLHRNGSVDASYFSEAEGRMVHVG